MPIQELREHVNTLLPKTDSILDFDTGNNYMTDDEVKAFISDTYGIDPFNIQLLSKDKRNEILREAKDLGATYRQLVRLTGLSYAIIRKA